MTALSDLVLSSPNLRARLGYRRFQQSALDVLVIDARYHIVGEVKRALTALGHRVWSLPVAEDAEVMVRALLTALVQRRPDFVLTINHHGFDESGSIGTILNRLEIPVAAWYVDAPFFVLRGRPVPAREMSVLFTWERTFVPLLSRECCTEYLPLAVDALAFQGEAQEKASGITFVGNSGTRAHAKWRLRLGDEMDTEEVRTIATELRARTIDAIRRDGLRTDALVADRVAAAAWLGTTDLRVQLLSAFSDEALTVHGDEGWQEHLTMAQLRPEVPYGPPLAAIYRSSAVNLNVTSLQMPTAVNQRLFDVPAAGGFLLTDAQTDVHQLFAEDEIAVYSDPDEAVDKARYYVKHPTRRVAMVERARARVANEHRYEHRVEALVGVMRDRFGPARAVRHV